MNPHQKARIESLYSKLKNTSAEGRAKALREEDHTLRAEVEKLLADENKEPPETIGESELWAPLPEDPSAKPPLSTLTGKRISHYVIGESIGSGGMGNVYQARRVDDYEQLVAFKVIKSGFESEELQQRLQSERQILAKLNHPNIARLLDGGATPEKQPFIVMEYIAGKPIDAYCDAKQLPTRERIRLLVSVAEAVHYAHQLGIIHRDLKPSNVLVTEDGIAKVVDFGLAKQFQSEPNATQLMGQTETGAILGTPSYMAPEQAGGKRKGIAPQTDVHALGAIMFELLTGRPPFRSDSPLNTLMQVLNEEPVPPSRLQPDLPRDLETICLKCLRKEPSARYATAKELADDIQRFLNGDTILARPVGPVERTWRWCRRHPVVAALTGLVFVLLVTVALTSTWMARREQELRRATEQSNRELERALYRQRIAVAERELSLRHNIARAEDLLQQCPPNLRGWEWRYLHRQLDGPRPPLRGHKAAVWSVAFSPDGKQLASCSTDGHVRLWDSQTGKIATVYQGHIPLPFRVLPSVNIFPSMCASFSPDGKRIASGGLTVDITKLKLNFMDLTNPLGGNLLKSVQPTGMVRVWDARTQKEIFQYSKHKDLVLSTAYSPDGKTIASAGFDSTVHLWDAKTGATKHVLRGHNDWVGWCAFRQNGQHLFTAGIDRTLKLWDVNTGEELRSWNMKGPVQQVAVSRDDRYLAFATLEGIVQVWDIAGYKPLHQFRAHNGGAASVSFHPTEPRLASAGFDKTVRIWDLKTGKETITLRGHTDTVFNVAFSPDGNLLASASFDFTVRVWDARPVEDDSASKFICPKGHTERVNDVLFSPDGKMLASSAWDNSVRLWDAKTGEQLHKLHGPKTATWSMAFSPDGSKIAAASWDRHVRVWDTKTGKLLHTLPHKAMVHGVAFSPDGKRLASGSVDGHVKIWDAESGEKLQAFRGHFNLIYSVAFSPDGKYLATASGDRNIKIWNADTGDHVKNLRGHESVVYRIQFHGDGKHLVSASWDKTLRLWDVDAGKSIRVFRGHTDRVHGVTIAPDGKHLLSASEDKSVRIWNLQTGELAATPIYHRGVVWSIAVSPDGQRAASASWYKKAGLRIWKME